MVLNKKSKFVYRSDKGQRRSAWTLAYRQRAVPSQRSRCHFKRKILSFFWFLICSTGLFIHGWFTTFDYLKYEMSTLITVLMPTKINPPAVSLCFDLQYIVNESAIPESVRANYKHCAKEFKLNDSCMDEVFKWMASLNVKQLLENWTFNLTKFNDPSYEASLTVQEYYRHGRKCFKYTR